MYKVYGKLWGTNKVYYGSSAHGRRLFPHKLKILPNGNIGQMSSRSLGCCEDLNMSWKRGEDHEKINMAPT